jgi:glucose/arabinose dehydrogenase
MVSVASVLAAGLVSVVVGPASPAGAAVPPGFTDALVAQVPAPTALAFTPDRRMLVTSQGGTLRVVQGGTLLPTPALDLTGVICADFERGLLGVAVDPAFSANSFVYLYSTRRTGALCDSSAVNRLSRYVMSGNTLSGEVVLLDNIPSPAGNHNGGDVQFGPDGMLYVSVGDGGCDYPGGTPSGCGAQNDAARDRHVLLGKVLRIDRNGNVPPDNPFTGAGTARCATTGRTTAGLVCQETYAWGLRNPYRVAFDPNSPTPRLHINDVGQATWEEVDLGSPGADYGWNVREGHCATGSTTDCGPPPAGMTNPIFDYGRADGCRSITGGAFVPQGVWPAPYGGRYLFADFACGKIFRLDPAPGGGFTRTEFATGLGSNSVVHLAFGPWRSTQALYYTTYAGGGQVRRVVYPAGTTAGDYDRDGDTDVAVFRPTTNIWYLRTTSPQAVPWGTQGDVPTPGDYDGDGDTDVAVFRPGSGAWYLRTPTPQYVEWAGDIPVQADYDGDGITDVATYRYTESVWYLRTSSPQAVVWGAEEDVPVPGDYDGDGDDDLAVFRPSTGVWYLRTAGPQAIAWGSPGDVPVPGDYDGDGDDDLAVFRPNTGVWYLRTNTPQAVPWGAADDIPTSGDYDGDGDVDPAVFRPTTGVWYLRTTSPQAVAWGAPGDVPLPMAPSGPPAP